MAANNTFRTKASALLAALLLARPQQWLLNVCALPTHRLASRDNGQSGASADGAFQTLASATQNLAALAGVFGTDSVEKYSFDYTKGFLVPAMSKCSLLGVLGFVRALLKLGIGRKACQRAGYALEPLQPYMGLADDHLLPSDMFGTVTYLERREIGNQYEWRVVKRLQHTYQSLAAVGGLWNRSGYKDTYDVCRISLSKSRSVFLIAGSIAILVAAAATSFPVLVLTGNSWQSLLASYGLFGSLSIGSLLWMWIFSQEQLPLEDTRFFGLSGPIYAFEGFAFWEHGNRYAAFRCRAVSGRVKGAISSVSVLSALIATVAYLFQYVSLQRMTTEKVGIWVGWQAGLMLLRLFVWLWQPGFPTPRSFRTESAFTDSIYNDIQRVLYGLRLEEILIMHCTLQYTKLRLSRSLAEVLGYVHVPKALALSRRICLRDSTDTVKQAVEAVKKSQDWWDFGDHAFSRWLACKASLHGSLDAMTTGILNRRCCCRIVRTGDGTLYLLPGILIPRVSRTTGNFCLMIHFAVSLGAENFEESLCNDPLCFRVDSLRSNGLTGGEYISDKDKTDLRPYYPSPNVTQMVGNRWDQEYVTVDWSVENALKAWRKTWITLDRLFPAPAET